MKLLSAGLRWSLSAFLVLHGVGAAAAPADAEMRAALSQFTAAEKFDAKVPLLTEQGRLGYVKALMEGLHSGFEKNKGWSEARRARAHELVDELEPQLAALANQQLVKIDLRAKAVTITEAIYAKLFNAAEIRQLAAHASSPAYRKLASLDAASQAEAARTGQDSDALFKKFVAERMTAEENRQVDAFEATPLGQKHRAHAPAIKVATDKYMRLQVAMMQMEMAGELIPMLNTLRAKLPADEPRPSQAALP
jgi:hypothetical protein